jgi:hypothetical protein
MIYIVQTNLINNDDLELLKEALNAEKADWYPVKVAPFMYDYVEGEPSPGFFDNNPVVVYGSGTLVRVAQNRGWGPGVWNNANLSYDKYIEHYGAEMLNYDSVVHRFKDVPKFDGIRFIRPVNDGKAFAGEVIESENFEIWRDQVLELGAHTFPETAVLVSTVKKTLVEWRFFVVDKKVVSGSRYSYQGRLWVEDLRGRDMDIEAWQYAQSQVDKWQPADAFVIDVVELDTHEFKIVELNNLNAAGFYASNIRLVIQAIEKMFGV